MTYREKMLLPRAADVKLRVFESSDEKELTTIVERLIPTEGRQVPISFSVLLPQSINSDHYSSVGAEILIGGKVSVSHNERDASCLHTATLARCIWC